MRSSAPRSWIKVKFGTKPDLEKLPMYCVVFSWKSWYDAKDMRATGGNDVNFAMDAPKEDSPDVADLRAKGAISFAIANASATGGPTSQTGPEKAKSGIPREVNNYAFGAWGRPAPCNPHDTERVPRGTSSDRECQCRRIWRRALSASKPLRRARDPHPATTSSTC